MTPPTVRGLLGALRDEGVDVSGRQVLVLGAGGAARAIVHALGTAGARVTVAARRAEAGERAAALAPGASSIDFTDLDAAAAAADIIVNATPIGMQGEAPLFDPGVLTAAQFVYDTVYHPSPTPLLAEAAARGDPQRRGPRDARAPGGGGLHPLDGRTRAIGRHVGRCGRRNSIMTSGRP